MLYLLYGCKVNQYESNAIEQQFFNNKYEIVENTKKADIYVINTCTVTNIAERKSRQMIRRAKQLNPDAIVVACGCYVEVSKTEVENLEEVDIILNDREKKEIVKHIEEFIENRVKKFNKENDNKEEFIEYGTVTYTDKNRAVIKVQDGCNMFCTYCIIPYARGRIRSRKVENILKEITEIAKNGIKEVVITGIHISSYGKDWNNGNLRLIDLLEKINDIEGIERIRLGSLEPTIITEEFLERLKKLEKICHHFHLSLQSGCNDTLKRMNRKYTTEQFENICKLLRNTYPDVNLTTDVIVGFPGETIEEFEKTFDFLSQIKFYKMHIFKYSPRKGTIAAKMPEQIDGNIKEERSNRLINMSNNYQNEYNAKYVGKSQYVLFEEIENGYLKGHTSNYMEIKVKAENIENPEILIDKIKSVKIIEEDSKNMQLLAVL